MDTHELIEKKLDGELTEAEATEFARRLRDEPDFAQQYQRYQGAIRGLREQFKQDLRRELEANARPASSKPEPVLVSTTEHSYPLRYWPGAVAALIVVAVGLWLVWPASTVPAERLADRYYAVYPAGSVVRSDASAVARDSAYQLYQQRQYAAAIRYWRQLATRGTEVEVPLWLGHSYWQTGQLDSAAVYFTRARQSDDALVRQHGTWYLALVYLRQGNTEATRSLLQDLLASGNLYKREVTQLLEQIDP